MGDEKITPRAPSHPRSRYALNDYNLSPDGTLRRGTLTPGEGVMTSNAQGIRGQRSITAVLGANVRSALNWRANVGERGGFLNLLRLFSGVYFAESGNNYGPAIGDGLPFGWMRRRQLGWDLWQVGPVWYFLPRLSADYWWKLVYFLEQRRIVDVRWTSTGTELLWWPTFNRFSYEDEVNASSLLQFVRGLR